MEEMNHWSQLYLLKLAQCWKTQSEPSLRPAGESPKGGGWVRVFEAHAFWSEWLLMLSADEHVMIPQGWGHEQAYV